MSEPTIVSSQQLAAHSLRLRLLDRIERSTRPEIRQTLYEQFRQLSALMGLSTPPLDSIGRGDPKEPEKLARLWIALDQFRASGIAYNHAYDPKLLAISIPHIEKLCIEQRIALPPGSQMRRFLAASPRFVEYRTVRSKLTGRSVKCWVFATEDAPRTDAA